jgi:hypothetical protein
MDILDHPDAQPLLDDAELSPEAVRSCAGRLEAFAARYLPRFARQEQRDHALTVLRGKLTGLQRKTTEPIATQAGQQRRPLQLFVGAGGWDDHAVRTELRRHVAEELGHPDAAFVLDSSAFAKKGQESCGVARQWCGRLGKLDNCQVGVFLAYAAPRGKALLDAQLYWPQDWAADARRRDKAQVPADVAFAEKWRLGLALLDAARGDLPGRWVAGTMTLAAAVSCVPPCGCGGCATCWTCPATLWYGTRSSGDRRRGAAGGLGCRSSSGWTVGWHDSRRAGGGP